jgi:hypothetical protein
MADDAASSSANIRAISTCAAVSATTNHVYLDKSGYRRIPVSRGIYNSYTTFCSHASYF